MFQFAVGDLAAAVSGLQGFDRSQIASGECKWNRTALEPDGLDVKMYNASRIQILIPFACHLEVNGTKVLHLRLTSSWMVRVVPADNHVDFRAAEVHFYTTYDQVGPYVVSNKALADFYVDSLFDHVRGQRLFGSGFPVDPRKRASSMVLEDSFIIFDKTAS